MVTIANYIKDNIPFFENNYDDNPIQTQKKDEGAEDEASTLKNMPEIIDNIRLHMIKNIYDDVEIKGICDNFTMILLNLQNYVQTDSK